MRAREEGRRGEREEEERAAQREEDGRGDVPVPPQEKAAEDGEEAADEPAELAVIGSRHDPV
jgi:hypothetical protein